MERELVEEEEGEGADVGGEVGGRVVDGVGGHGDKKGEEIKRGERGERGERVTTILIVLLCGPKLKNERD